MNMRLTLLFTLLLAANSMAGTEFKRIAPQFHLQYSEEYEISNSQAVFRFQIKHTGSEMKSKSIRYSIDGEQARAQLEDFSFDVTTTPGKHRIIIYLSSDYDEMYSDSLLVKGGYIDTYNVYARWAMQEVIMDKPIIYLYPETSQKVNVKVDPVGEFSFTYPAYEDGWTVTANEDGTIEHKGESYNYLFWESKQQINVSNMDPVGFAIEKDDVLEFLENQLNSVGFTSQEKADFITFWAPRMIQYDEVFIQFTQGENCDKYATLEIEPQPDHINRFYMTWGEYKGGMVIIPQKLTKMNRSGFDVLEWGGNQVELGEIPETL